MVNIKSHGGWLWIHRDGRLIRKIARYKVKKATQLALKILEYGTEGPPKRF